MTSSAKRVGQLLAAVAVVGLLALLVWKTVSGDEGISGSLARGERPNAPPFALTQLNGSDAGQPLALGDLRGKAVVVNFWASWCIPCKEEAPFLQDVYERYRDRGLVVLGIDSQDLRPDALRFIKRFGLTYPIVFDGRRKALRAWGIRAFPETFFVDRSGRLVGERIAGGVDLKRNRDAFDEGVRLSLGSS